MVPSICPSVCLQFSSSVSFSHFFYCACPHHKKIHHQQQSQAGRGGGGKKRKHEVEEEQGRKPHMDTGKYVCVSMCVCVCDRACVVPFLSVASLPHTLPCAPQHPRVPLQKTPATQLYWLSSGYHTTRYVVHEQTHFPSPPTPALSHTLTNNALLDLFWLPHDPIRSA